MANLKKTFRLEFIFLAYNLIFALYMLAAIPITVIVTGKYALLVFLGSLFVTGLAIYACIKAKVKPSLMHGLALGFYGWMLVGVCYHFSETGTDNIAHILLLFCMVLPCFLSFLTFTKEQIATQWKLLAIVYNLVMTILSIAGIYCTLYSIHRTFDALGYRYIAFLDLKLYLLSHYNTTAQMIAFAMLLCIFMIVHTTKTWVRVVFALDLAIFYITLGLTYSRTVELVLSACFGIAICYFIWHAKKLQTPTLQLKNILLRLSICGATFVAVVVISYSGMVACNTQAVNLRRTITAQTEATAVATATAERAPTQTDASVLQLTTQDTSSEASTTFTTTHANTSTASATNDTAQTTPQAYTTIDTLTEEERIAILQDTRSLSDLSTIGARFAYWSAAFTYFIETPECQLWGASPAGVVLILAEVIPDYQPPHTHNVFLQVLMATGIPGFVFFIALWGIALFHAAKAFFAPNGRFAENCFPLLMILTFSACGLQENIMFSTENTPLLTMYFMAVAAVASLQQKKNKGTTLD